MKKLIKCIALTTILTCTCFSCQACKNDNTVLIYSCANDAENNDLHAALTEKFPDYNIVIQYIGTGETYAKLLAEGEFTEADIVLSLDGCYAHDLVTKVDCFTDLSEYDVSMYADDILEYTSEHKKFIPQAKLNAVVAYSKSVLSEHNVNVPTTYEELTDEKYKDLIVISNPKTSGTGYTFYHSLEASLGLEKTIDYFNRLSNNLQSITSSGSATLKAVDRKQAGISFSMLWQTVSYSNSNPDIGYTFLDLPSGYDVYVMACIKNKEKDEHVKNVFDYIYSTWNKHLCEEFYSGKTYKENNSSNIANFPFDISEPCMIGLYDVHHKQKLLDAWPL